MGTTQPIRGKDDLKKFLDYMMASCLSMFLLSKAGTTYFPKNGSDTIFSYNLHGFSL